MDFCGKYGFLLVGSSVGLEFKFATFGWGNDGGAFICRYCHRADGDCPCRVAVDWDKVELARYQYVYQLTLTELQTIESKSQTGRILTKKRDWLLNKIARL